ncbi:MAG: hypothetical protein IPH00_07585 [Flavobacteriales bacterium]|nr:hypothetical protein [Flavobacteriales bacterium]
MDYRQGEMTASSSIGEMLLVMGLPDSALVMLNKALTSNGPWMPKRPDGAHPATARNRLPHDAGRPSMPHTHAGNEAVRLAKQLGDASGRPRPSPSWGGWSWTKADARAALERCTEGLALALPRSPPMNAARTANASLGQQELRQRHARVEVLRPSSAHVTA